MKKLLMVLSVLALMVAFSSLLNQPTTEQATWFGPEPLSSLM